MKQTHWNILTFLVRLVLLGLIIYLLLSYIQDATTHYTNETKLIITVVVVLIYGMVDLLWSKLSVTTGQMCQLFC